MEQGIKQTQRDYSLAFKLSVVEQVEKGRVDVQRSPTTLWNSGPLYSAGMVT
ncbi:hypothetical protein PCA31118_02635 [Pandoraea captiosa]|uniref:Transposase n=1 Tax=Pandoraea captiosa TaxID=2508302 RepID=A0A5E5A633_9BURK|nr:hypothetical protein PCA31118_02635 [Pandoraea captiosa]